MEVSGLPLSAERLRITPTPQHSDEMMDRLVTALGEVWARLEIRRAA